MRCPKCKADDTQIIDSRANNEKNIIRRRRICRICKYRFTTFEKLVITNLIVVKANGRFEAYDRNKVLKSILIATKKRGISLTVIDDIISKLEEKWLGKDTNLTTKEIGEDILDALKKIDDVAYIRFASVYKNFRTVEQFIKEIEKTKNKFNS